MAERLIWVNDTTTGSETIHDVSSTFPLPVSVGGSSGGTAVAVEEQAPLYTHHAAAVQYSRDNHTNATIDSIVDCSDYDVAIVQFVKRGGTDTVTFTAEATAQDDGTAGTSTDLDDITISGTPLDGTTAAATYTATVMLRYDISAFKFFNPTITSSGGSNDADFDLYVRFS